MDILSYPFDAEQMMRQKKAIRKELLAQQGLMPKRIAILSGSTIGDIKKILELFLLERGILPTFYVGQYNRFYEEAVFENEELDAFAPELVFVHTSFRNISALPPVCCTQQQEKEAVQRELNRFLKVADSLQKKYGCTVVQNNFEPPTSRVMGNLDGGVFGGGVRFVHLLNEGLFAAARENESLKICDINYLCACYGLDKWADHDAWYLYKYALAVDAIPTLCHQWASIAAAVFGKRKKAIALDLDNTLWGGVIGDDGMDGIVLGTETPQGYAFYEFQQYLKRLNETGVLLTVCSKNEEQTAKSGFAHPFSVLKPTDFTAFVANWQSKAQNIANMAKKINILTDGFVFVDDNPAERQIVKDALPAVAVPKMDNVSDYIKMLDRSGYFEPAALSKDDAMRAKMYQENAAREEAQADFENYEDYLKSLEMMSEILPIVPETLARAVQLVNKTNQFNVCASRLTAAETEKAAEEGISLAAMLGDKFGDNGLVSVLLASADADTAKITTWVMSCRVFLRDLEKAMLDALVYECRRRGIKRIIGVYTQTAKNGFVKDLYENLGFEKQADGSFVLENLAAYQNKNNVIGVKQ